LGQLFAVPSSREVSGVTLYRLNRKRTKYGAKAKRCREGVMHQSTLEARRCSELHLMQKGGLISDLEAHPQPRYRLDVEGVHICDYLADFRYLDTETGEEVVEDVKGWRTEVYKLKKRLMLACFGIEIREVTR
jgi:hypothetical protein